MSRVGFEREGKGRALLFHFLRRVMRRLVIANRGAHHEDIAVRELRGRGLEHFVAGRDAHDFRAGGRASATGPEIKITSCFSSRAAAAIA